MSWLFRRLGDALGPLTVIPIAPDMAVKTAPGKAQSHTWIYSSPHVRRMRFTYVDAGANAQIFNCVVYPRPDGGIGEGMGEGDVAEEKCLGDAPLLGVDLLCLAGGKKILVGVDLQPMSREEEYLERYSPALAAIRDERFADLNLVQPSKKFYEDATYFSPAMLFARPKVKRKSCGGIL